MERSNAVYRVNLKLLGGGFDLVGLNYFTVDVVKKLKVCIPGILSIDNAVRRNGNLCLTNDVKEEWVKVKWDEGCFTEINQIIKFLDHYAVRWITISGGAVKKNPKTVAWNEVLKITILDTKTKKEYIDEEKRARARSRAYQEEIGKLSKPTRTSPRIGPKIELNGKQEQKGIDVKKPTIVRTAAKPIVIERKKDLEEKVQKAVYEYDEKNVKYLGKMTMEIAIMVEEKIEEKYGKETDTQYFEDENDPEVEVPVVLEKRKLDECFYWFKNRQSIIESNERQRIRDHDEQLKYTIFCVKKALQNDLERMSKVMVEYHEDKDDPEVERPIVFNYKNFETHRIWAKLNEKKMKEENEIFYHYRYYQKQVEAWKEPTFIEKGIKTIEEFKAAFEKWQFVKEPVDVEWVEASVRVREEYSDDYEGWKRDKWIRQLAMEDVGYDPEKKQKKVTKSQRRERNRRDELGIKYDLENSCPRSHLWTLEKEERIEESLSKMEWSRIKDEENNSEKWKGKKRRKNETNSTARWAINIIRDLEWRRREKSVIEAWKQIEESIGGTRAQHWKNYMEEVLLEIIEKEMNEAQLEELL
jgi:hypothetical protein